MRNVYLKVFFFAVSTKCCDRSQSTQCRSVCRSLFIEDSTPTEAQRSALNRFCGHRVTQCVRNHTQDTPVHNPAESKYDRIPGGRISEMGALDEGVSL